MQAEKLKTPNELLHGIFKGIVIPSTTIMDLESAMKQYAKQWIDSAMMFQGNSMEMLEYMHHLKHEIDTQ